MTAYEPATPFRVPVAGGELAGGQWHADADGMPLVGIHGITANHVSWAMIAAALPGVRVIAPDLRGRGRSGDLPGPYGMADHADDVARMLDGLGVERAVVVRGDDELRAVIDEPVHAAAAVAAEHQLVGRAGAVAALEHPLEEDVVVGAARGVADRVAARGAGDGLEQRRSFGEGVRSAGGRRSASTWALCFRPPVRR